MAGGFVQHQDARIFENDPRQGNALLFTAAQAVAALADDGIVAIGQPHDEIMNVGGAGRRFKFGLGGIQAGIQQVGADGIVEQVRFLGHHADLRAERIERDLAQIHAVQQNAPAGRVVQARDQVGEGGFACPAMAPPGPPTAPAAP